jgi:hypothetical protein
MSGKQFFYKRWEERVINNEKVIVEFPESFNIDKVLVSRWIGDDYCIWLEDGHEQAMPVDIPAGTKVVNADKLKPIKSREWVLTQIILRGPDIARFRKAGEMIIEIDEQSDSFKKAQPRIIHIPKEEPPKESIPPQGEEKGNETNAKVVSMNQEEKPEQKDVFAEVEENVEKI